MPDVACLQNCRPTHPFRGGGGEPPPPVGAPPPIPGPAAWPSVPEICCWFLPTRSPGSVFLIAISLSQVLHPKPSLQPTALTQFGTLPSPLYLGPVPLRLTQCASQTPPPPPPHTHTPNPASLMPRFPFTCRPPTAGPLHTSRMRLHRALYPFPITWLHLCRLTAPAHRPRCNTRERSFGG